MVVTNNIRLLALLLLLKSFFNRESQQDILQHPDNLPGYEWTVSDNYTAKYLPEEGQAPKAELTAPSAGSPEDHAIINKEILGALGEGRGEIIKGEVEGWRQGPAEQKIRINRMVAALGEYHDKVIDLGALGRVDVSEELKRANIIFIAPRHNAPPAFFVKRGLFYKAFAPIFPILRYNLPSSACRIAHTGLKRNSVYIIRPLAIQMSDEELAGVIAEELIESAAKRRAAQNGIEWTAKLSRAIYKRASQYSRKLTLKSGPLIKKKIASDISGIQIDKEPLSMEPKPQGRKPLVTIFIPTRARREYFFEIFRRVEALEIDKEIVIVINGTRQARADILEMTRALAVKKDVVILENAEDHGKGAAVQTALGAARGEIFIIQDPDLEYNPEDIPHLIAPIISGDAKVVFGSRVLGAKATPIYYKSTLNAVRFWMGLAGMRLLVRLLFGVDLTDMGTGYKLAPTSILRELRLESEGFELESEMLAKLLRRGYTIKEYPIYSYARRTSLQGKSFNFHDAYLMIRVFIDYFFMRSKRREAKWLRFSTKRRDLKTEPISVTDKLQKILKEYDLGVENTDTVEHEELPGGISTRRPLLLKSPKGSFVLKYAGDSLKKARFVVSTALAVTSSAIPDPAIHRTNRSILRGRDRYLIKIGAWYYYLEDYNQGVMIEREKLTSEHFFKIGSLIARVHGALLDFKPAGKKRELAFNDIVTAERDFMELIDYLSKKRMLTRGEILFMDSVNVIMPQLRALKEWSSVRRYAKLRKSVVHADISFGNILWDEALSNIISLFDWERARFQPRIEDFKNSALSAGAEKGRKYSREELVALLKGYQTHSKDKLTEDELDAIPFMLGAGTFLWDFANWFILKMFDVDNKDQSYALVQGLLRENLKIENDFKEAVWWQSLKDKLLGNNVKELLSKPDSEKNLSAALDELDTYDTQLFLMHLAMQDTIVLEEYLTILSKALSLSLKRPDAKKIALFLEEFLASANPSIRDEAKIFIRSYLSVFNVDRGMKVAYCVSLWKGQKKYPDAPRGKGWLRKNVERFLKEALAVNPKIQGDMVFINDGDDTDESGKKTSDILKELLKDDLYNDVRNRIHILELAQEDKLLMGSVKHGALASAMRFATDRLGADIVIYSDGDMDLRQVGLLIGKLANEEAGAAFGSAREKGSVVSSRGFVRSMGTIAYNYWARLLLPAIRGVKDTQRSFKGFKREALKDILPVRIISSDDNGRLKLKFDRDFAYNFSGDTEWLARSAIAGYKVKAAPIVWIDAPETSTVDFSKYMLPMFKSVYYQRSSQARFSAAIKEKNSSARLFGLIESVPKDGALSKDPQHREAHSGIASLIALARKAKKEKQKLIIGLETDWIPGINIKGSLQRNAISSLMSEIDSIGQALQSMGLDNVRIVRGSSSNLADNLAKEAGKDGKTDMHNIVVMASAGTINSPSFAPLRAAPENDRPFLTGINPEELIKLYDQYGESAVQQLHIKLMTLLYMTLEIASGKEPPKAPWIKYDSAMRVLILIPGAEIMDCEKLRKAYRAEITALQAA